MPEAWTTRRLIAWIGDDLKARGIASPRLDAELMVAHALGCDRVKLYMDLDRPWLDPELAAARELLKRRRAFEPIAYIRGEREFYGRPFRVDRRVLIPRPDTETLIERALALLVTDQPTRVLDLCTGSGAIGVTLAAERPLAHVDVTDLSTDALAVASDNAQRLGVSERVACLSGDLFAAVKDATPYQLIACNPPYIAEAQRSELTRDIVDHEPHLALFADEAGLALYRRLAPAIATHLVPGGAVLLEVGAGQAGAVMALLRAQPLLEAVTSWPDLAGIARVVEATRVVG
jgi:release factor glutamine methyltransferase